MAPSHRPLAQQAAVLLRRAVTQLRGVVKPIPGQDVVESAPGQDDHREEQLLVEQLAAIAVELWRRPVIKFLPKLSADQGNLAHPRYFDLELQLIVWQSEDIQFNANMTSNHKLKHFARLLVCSYLVHMSPLHLKRVRARNSDWSMFAGGKQLQRHCKQAGAGLLFGLRCRQRLIQGGHRDGSAKIFQMKLFKLAQSLPATLEVRKT